MKKINVEPRKEKKFEWISDITNNFMTYLEWPPLENLNGKKVVLYHNALNKAIIYYAVTQKVQGDVEIMGWLAGRVNENSIEIVDAYIGNCMSSIGHTELDATETIRLKKQAKKEGLVLLGQWHSHPSFSTHPSSTDADALNTMKMFGIKHPISLIVNSTDFWLGTIYKNHTRKVKFIIPSKRSNKIGLKLDFINGEYTYQPEPIFWDNNIPQEHIGFVGWLDIIVNNILDWLAGIEHDEVKDDGQTILKANEDKVVRPDKN
jgi:proteasome lid subunit RPN8/RPN11